MTKGSGTRRPVWLTALGVLALAAIGGALAYAVAIASVNFSRIGV